MAQLIRIAPLVCLMLLAGSMFAPAWATPSQLSAQDRKLYRQAFDEAAARHFDRARALAARASNPQLANVILWLDLTRGGGDFAEIAAFFRDHPNWPYRSILQRRAEDTMPPELPDGQVLAWFDSVPATTVNGAIRHADALLRGGRKDAATALVRRTWINQDFSKAQEAAFRDRYMKLLKREDFVARLDRLLWDKRAAAARDQARRLGDGYPHLAEARLALAANSPGVDHAIARVPKALQGDPGLLYERARWRQRRDRLDGVIELLDPPNPKLADPERWWRLRFWAAREAMSAGDYSAAHRVAAGHGLESGLGFAECEWLAGWIALSFLAEPRQAYLHFSRLYDGVSSPISRARGAYWAGEAASALGKRDWANQWYQVAAGHSTTFYGQLAANRMSLALVPQLPNVAAPTPEGNQHFAQQELVRIVRLLGEIDEIKVQETFLIRLRAMAETAEDFILVAELALEQGRRDLALRTAKEASYQGLILPDHLFPIPEFGMPGPGEPEHALVLALIRQESEFSSGAISPSGARGLMQLMPGTAKGVAKQLKLGFNNDRLITDEAYNLRLGQAYLGDLLTRFGHSYPLALAAYNAGPSRVDAWIREFGDPRQAGIDTVEWMERIPFYETRNYVQRVLESLSVYRHRLDTHRTSLPLGTDVAERWTPSGGILNGGSGLQ